MNSLHPIEEEEQKTFLPPSLATRSLLSTTLDSQKGFETSSLLRTSQRSSQRNSSSWGTSALNHNSTGRDPNHDAPVSSGLVCFSSSDTRRGAVSRPEPQQVGKAPLVFTASLEVPPSTSLTSSVGDEKREQPIPHPVEEGPQQHASSPSPSIASVASSNTGCSSFPLYTKREVLAGTSTHPGHPRNRSSSSPASPPPPAEAICFPGGGEGKAEALWDSQVHDTFVSDSMATQRCAMDQHPNENDEAARGRALLLHRLQGANAGKGGQEASSLAAHAGGKHSSFPSTTPTPSFSSLSALTVSLFRTEKTPHGPSHHPAAGETSLTGGAGARSPRDVPLHLNPSKTLEFPLGGGGGGEEHKKRRRIGDRCSVRSRSLLVSTTNTSTATTPQMATPRSYSQTGTRGFGAPQHAPLYHGGVPTAALNQRTSWWWARKKDPSPTSGEVNPSIIQRGGGRRGGQKTIPMRRTTSRSSHPLTSLRGPLGGGGGGEGGEVHVVLQTRKTSAHREPYRGGTSSRPRKAISKQEKRAPSHRYSLLKYPPPSLIPVSQRVPISKEEEEDESCLENSEEEDEAMKTKKEKEEGKNNKMERRKRKERERQLREMEARFDYRRQGRGFYPAPKAEGGPCYPAYRAAYERAHQAAMQRDRVIVAKGEEEAARVVDPRGVHPSLSLHTRAGGRGGPAGFFPSPKKQHAGSIETRDKPLEWIDDVPPPPPPPTTLTDLLATGRATSATHSPILARGGEPRRARSSTCLPFSARLYGGTSRARTPPPCPPLSFLSMLETSSAALHPRLIPPIRGDRQRTGRRRREEAQEEEQRKSNEKDHTRRRAQSGPRLSEEDSPGSSASLSPRGVDLKGGTKPTSTTMEREANASEARGGGRHASRAMSTSTSASIGVRRPLFSLSKGSQRGGTQEKVVQLHGARVLHKVETGLSSRGKIWLSSSSFSSSAPSSIPPMPSLVRAKRSNSVVAGKERSRRRMDGVEGEVGQIGSGVGETRRARPSLSLLHHQHHPSRTSSGVGSSLMRKGPSQKERKPDVPHRTATTTPGRSGGSTSMGIKSTAPPHHATRHATPSSSFATRGTTTSLTKTTRTSSSSGRRRTTSSSVLVSENTMKRKGKQETKEEEKADRARRRRRTADESDDSMPNPLPLPPTPSSPSSSTPSPRTPPPVLHPEYAARAVNSYRLRLLFEVAPPSLSTHGTSSTTVPHAESSSSSKTTERQNGRKLQRSKTEEVTEKGRNRTSTRSASEKARSLPLSASSPASSSQWTVSSKRTPQKEVQKTQEDEEESGKEEEEDRADRASDSRSSSIGLEEEEEEEDASKGKPRTISSSSSQPPSWRSDEKRSGKHKVASEEEKNLTFTWEESDGQNEEEEERSRLTEDSLFFAEVAPM